MKVRDRARYVPAIPPAAVARVRLDELLEQTAGRVVRVLAPAGYGKTTLVARWVANDERVVGWLDVERVDNDPAVLLLSLARALSEIDGFDVFELPGGPGGERFVETVVPEFGAMVRGCRTPFVLVLDDIHRVDAPSSLALLDALARNLGPESTLLMAGRRYEAEESIAKLRLHPGVIDVTVHDLALTITEADEMLSAIGVEIDLDDLATLTERFEGWPAGIRLAALVMEAGGDPFWTSVADAGDATFVTDYLRAEWMGQLASADRGLLGEAACLERFTGAMCDEILGRHDSAADLRRLQRKDLVVLPLDRRDEWFRMHSLLARWLAAELHHRDRDRWREVHSRAARWWADHGDVDLAFDHALLIDDVDYAESLVATHAPARVTSGHLATVQRWLAAFPADQVVSSPSLCAMSAVVAMQIGDGDRTLAWVEALGRLTGSTEPSGSPPADVHTRAMSDVLTAAFVPRPASELIPIAERALDHLDPGPWCDLTLQVITCLRYLRGDVDAPATLDEAIFDAEVRDTTVTLARCLALRATFAELRDDWQQAERDGRRAGEILAACRPEGMPATTVDVIAINAVLDARAGRVADAKRGIDGARRQLAGFAAVAPWYNVLQRLALIRACLLVDRRTVAAELIAEADRFLRLEHPDNPAGRHLADFRSQLDATRSTLPRGTALTSAELNVMRYLPTNLTLAEIATRLYVSRNTVKSHVAAIYRKLGTTSRSEAVELARGAGLLTESAVEPVRIAAHAPADRLPPRPARLT